MTCLRASKCLVIFVNCHALVTFSHFLICFTEHTFKCESNESCRIECPVNETLDIKSGSYGGRDTSLGLPDEETRE